MAGKIAEHNKLVQLLKDSIDKRAHTATQRMKTTLEDVPKRKQIEAKVKKIIDQMQELKLDAELQGFNVYYSGYGVPPATVTALPNHAVLQEIEKKRQAQHDALDSYSRDILLRELHHAKEDAGDIKLPDILKDLL